MTRKLALAAAAVLTLGLAACGGSGTPHPTVSTCAKAIEAHPHVSSWTDPSMAPCKGLTSDQRTKATLIAYGNGARG